MSLLPLETLCCLDSRPPLSPDFPPISVATPAALSSRSPQHWKGPHGCPWTSRLQLTSHLVDLIPSFGFK